MGKRLRPLTHKAFLFMEVWKKIVGFENYEVSNLGRIKSLSKKIKCVNGFRISKEKMLKNNTSGSYNRVQMGKDSKHLSIHRLVALTFIENPLNKPCVNHINGIKKDNRVENLEWVTYSENTKHAYNILNVPKEKINKINFKRGNEQHLSKLNNKQVKEIRFKYSKGLGVILGKEYNVSQTTILNIINNKIWIHI